MFFACKLFAQDPHFSQFFSSPLTLNPAFCGKFDGTIRAAGNHRNQWPSINRAFVTSSLTVDMPILRNKISSRDTWGVGISGLTDQGADGAVKFNYASLSTAYHIGLDEDGYHQLGAAFQATYANMLINVTNLKFEDQLTPFGFTGITSELFSGSTLKSNYIDVNAGILYTGSSNATNNYYAGVSLYHINRPEQQFTGANYVLNPRATFHAGGAFTVGYNSTLHLSGLYSSQAQAKETVIGGAMQWQVSDGDKPTSFYAGSWLRLGDALIPYVGLEYGDFRLGITYDVNTSALRTASNSRGGIEISLIYVKRPLESRGVPCPKF